MLWNGSFVFILITLLASSTDSYNSPPRGSSAWGYFNPPLLQRIPQTEQTPLETMVELTNELAIAILQDHSFSRGNFAFSPYGVASVLVVLYEGARGESARQIHRAIGFPSDKDIIRVGFRDIHRHLRSYFSHEGYLSGISLNREGSSLKPEYKKILRFYGYDVELNNAGDEEDVGAPSSSPETPQTTASVVLTEKPTTVKPTTVKPTTQKSTTQKPTTQKPTTQKPTTQKPTTQKPTTQEPTTQNPTTQNPTTQNPTTESPEIVATTTQTQKELEVTETTTVESDKTTTVSPTTATEPFENGDDENQTDLTTENNPNCSPMNEGKQEGCGVRETTTEKQNEDRETLLTSTELPVTEPKTTESENIATTDKTLDNGMLIPQLDDLETTETTTTDKSTTYSASTEMTSTIPSETTTLYFHEIKARERNWSLVALKSQINMSNNKTEIEQKRVSNIRRLFRRKFNPWLDATPRQPKYRKTRTITDYLKTPHNPELSLQLQNGMYDTHISRNANLYRSLPRLLFLVDGAIDTPVPMMTYTNVFSYAYIPRLHSKAMEFPLDDERYKLLILLPVERRGLRQLIYDLTGFPLSNVLRALRPQRVKAMVPTFMVEGFVILTSSLQKLGIWDVFDPRKANLSGMSMDPELYVRNVEQSVTVVIRNYVEILDIQTRTMAARQMEQEFEATHPFLYFVMDTATNVALMAGQILDPLNSRIY